MEIFQEIPHKEYNNLKILEKVGDLEREFGLCAELGIPIYLHSVKYKFFYEQLAKEQDHSLVQKIEDSNLVCKIDEFDNLAEILDDLVKYKPIILSINNDIFNQLYLNKLILKNSDKILYYNESDNKIIEDELRFYIEDGMLNYNNMINYCMIVKNAGDIFEKVLTDNLPIIDKWTILDTGSTDNTIEIINKVLVGKKKGKLYQEPFINFRESRNRCLDLCGKSCKYNLMLDDTYAIRGDLRGFLNEIRGDQFADSYSLLIISDDVEYYSNRITKSVKELRYIYILHEVIQKDNNINVVIPKDRAYIHDYRVDYMEKRTMARKEYDLKCLFQMIEEDPSDPRHYYYVAQTYNVMEKWEEAAEYYRKRAFHPSEGFDQEKIDALFELARAYNFKLNKPWEECEKLYKLCAEWDPERPDSVYFLGIHYYLDGDYKTAYEYLKKGFEIGYPIHRQYSLKPTLSFHFLPKFLTELCYRMEDYILGEKASLFFLQNNKSTDDYYNVMTDWYKIYQKINLRPQLSPNPVKNKEIFCFVIDGNWNKWTGKDILSKGLGGSETWAVETAKWIKKFTNYEVLFFCNTDLEETFQGVKYLPISQYYYYISIYNIKYAFISRYSEYIPVSIHSHVENIFVISHDLSLSGNIIPINEKIKKIYSLTHWHQEYLSNIFPQFKTLITPYNYGIDLGLFDGEGIEKVKNSFIYSSFPNRGLLVILRMWDKILKDIPDATLNIFCDLDHQWTNQYHGEEIKEIKELLSMYKNSITNHGWVSKAVLADYWKKSEVWFYPCKFKETFCLTALEAAASQTLVISNDLAALKNVVDDRGVVIPGDEKDVLEEEWQNQALEKIKFYLKNKEAERVFIEKNYSWAKEMSWENRTKWFLESIGEQIINKENNFFINDFEVYEERDDKITNKYWPPIQEILNQLYQFCEKNNHKNILELGPGDIPFKLATNFIDFHVNNERYQKIDLDFEKIKDKDRSYDFGYSRHLLEDLQNPDNAFQEMIRVCKSGFIETPSPLVEISKGVDSLTGSYVNLRGYRHHRWIIWSDYSTNTLHFFPKYNVIQILQINPDSESKLNSILNKYPIYWNNYYFFGGDRKPKFKVHKLFGKEDWSNLGEILYDGINKSIEYTNNFLNILIENSRFDSYKILNELNNLDYAGMYNWINDLPKGHKILFEDVLGLLRNREARILEIGAFAGMSIIAMLMYLPDATAVIIDKWQSYEEKAKDKVVTELLKMEVNQVENVFYKNRMNAGMVDRIQVMKGDSHQKLLELFMKGDKFDFIYVDGSHNPFNTYVDCKSSWLLLEKDGILGIDDYLYNTEGGNTLDRPFEGINRFLEEIEGEFEIISKTYRVFIRKV